MLQKPRYVHVGYPKCASSALQISFFGVHPELCHLGSGTGGRVNRYVDAAVCRAVEVDLRYKRELAYDEDRAAAAFGPHFEAAERLDGVRLVGISSEFLAFTLHNEIDLLTKAQRIRRILGPNTFVIIACREQRSILRALYLELVRSGYSGTFAAFVTYTYMFQDRNWCHELCFDRVRDLYVRLFGKRRVIVLLQEQLASSPSSTLSEISGKMGIAPCIDSLRRVNVRTMSLSAYEIIRRINERYPHECGGRVFEPPQAVRMQRYFEDELGVRLPHELLLNDYGRVHIARAAASLADRGAWPDINLDWPKEIELRLQALYAPANARLATSTGFDLREYDYWLP